MRRRVGAAAVVGVAVAAVALLLAAMAGGEVEPAAAPDARGKALRAAAAPAAERREAAPGWHGGLVVASTGERLTVHVSSSYPPEQVPPARWADFFAGLLHGSELGTVTIRVATPAEVSSLCGFGALGCYGGRELVTIGETVDGVTPEEVAAHEYGHHVAASRRNPPWNALTWGPKRWASAQGICGRVRAGTAFPGDQGSRYALDPGEAFAEAYRIHGERRSGRAGSAWGLVDGSFYPTDAALRALEQDVTRPWTRPTRRSHRVTFPAGRTRWTLRLAQPLDGELVVRLKVPPGRLDTLELLTADGRTTLARGAWTGTSEQRLSHVVCGTRKLLLRVTRDGPPRPASLTVSAP